MGVFRKLFGGAEGVREGMYETHQKFSAEFDQGKAGDFHGLAEYVGKNTAVLTATIQARYMAEWEIGDCLFLACLFPSIASITDWVIEFEVSSFFKSRDYRSHLLLMVGDNRISESKLTDAVNKYNTLYSEPPISVSRERQDENANLVIPKEIIVDCKGFRKNGSKCTKKIKVRPEGKRGLMFNCPDCGWSKDLNELLDEIQT